MRKRVVSILVVFTLVCAIPFAVAEETRKAAYENYLGIWVSDGIAVEIWCEDESIQCRAVLSDGSEESEIWEYPSCAYDEVEDALRCFGVTRTRELFDSLLNAIEELDWSMDDLSLAELRLVKDSLLFTDDQLDAPVALTRLCEAGDLQRNKALAFAGLWANESSTLRVEDHCACYRFTVTTLMHDDISYRWSYICLYDPDSGLMTSEDVSPRTAITREADGTIVEIEEDSVADGAEFILDDENRLIRRDMTDGKTAVFEVQYKTRR